MYGHIKALAEAEKKGIESAGGQAEIFQSVIPIVVTIQASLY